MDASPSRGLISSSGSTVARPVVSSMASFGGPCSRLASSFPASIRRWGNSGFCGRRPWTLVASNLCHAPSPSPTLRRSSSRSPAVVMTTREPSTRRLARAHGGALRARSRSIFCVSRAQDSRAVHPIHQVPPPPPGCRLRPPCSGSTPKAP